MWKESTDKAAEGKACLSLYDTYFKKCGGSAQTDSLIRWHNNENVGLNESKATTSAIYISDPIIESSPNIPKSTFLRMFTSACFTSGSRHGSNSTSAGVKNCDLYQYFLLELFGNIFGHLSPVEQGLNAKRCGRENRFSFRYSHPGHYHFL